MWIFNRRYFCSIKRHDNESPTLTVRFRVKHHAENFVSDLGLIKCPIEKSSDTDYMYRVHVNETDVAGVVARSIEDIDYPNFKDSIPYSDDNYYHALSKIWSNHYELQCIEDTASRHDLVDVEVIDAAKQNHRDQ